MTARLRINRAGPLTTVQDAGRYGMLEHGVSASGPMDRGAFMAAVHALGGGGATGIEFTAGGIDIEVVEGACRVGFAGGTFVAALNEQQQSWPGIAELRAGGRLRIDPGPHGNYGYLRFDKSIDLPAVMASRATNIRAGFGGLDGRSLVAGDILNLSDASEVDPGRPLPMEADNGSIRILWGLHAEVFPPEVRMRLLDTEFVVTSHMDRMGVRLRDPVGVFQNSAGLSLVSDAVVAGDIQILGDGTPIVLMRDHQPTGGYPRIATVIAADLDRFAQMRPGTRVRFESVSVSHAQSLTAKRSVRP